ncbi:MAG: OB-fold domain-containing protein [Desulfobacterales bacterium]|nr:OB-fold domain-containing protein [Desulfobacterales bacterium]MBF0395639.1 OB-fold domain-containing protein [Desulfobacterales bacterium]
MHSEDSFIVEGKLALPYQYFAGRTGSKFLVTLRDQKKIMGVRCNKCEKVFIPPRSTCEKCFSNISENWVELKPTGTVTGFTVVRYEEPHQPIKPPYILALIKLDGADTPFPHIVKGVPISKMTTGLRVKAVFAKKTTSTIMDIDHFRPDQKPKVQIGYTYEELEIGMSASFTKTISETDVYLFAGISGDFNPMHLDEEFAKKTPFKTRIAHGALPQSLIAPVLGMKLPGLGTVALEITTRFKAPTYFGDTITATGEVIEKIEKKKWIKMSLTLTNQRGEIIGDGTALVMPPNRDLIKEEDV